MEEEIEFIDNENNSSGNSKKKIILTLVVLVVIMVASLFTFLFYLNGDEKKVSDNSSLVNSSFDNKISQTEIKKQRALEVENRIVEPKWDLKEEILYSIPADHKFRKWSITFSSDGKSFAYSASREVQKDAFSVIDGKEVPWKAGLDEYFKNVSVSANAEKIVYTKQGTKYALFYNGKKLAENEDVIAGNISVNDKKQFAYYIQKKDGTRVPVINGNVGSEYQIIGPQNCSEDGQEFSCDRIAFAYDGKQNAYIAKKGSIYVTVLNEKEGKSYMGIYSPMFSFDSAHFAYKAFDGSKYFIVIDGEEQKKYDNVYNVKFNKDGSLTYNAMVENKILLVSENLKVSTIKKESTNQSQQNIDQQKFDVMNFIEEARIYATFCNKRKMEIVSANGGEKFCDEGEAYSNVSRLRQMDFCGDKPEDTRWIVTNGKSSDWTVELNCKNFTACNGKINASCNSERCVFSKNCDPREE